MLKSFFTKGTLNKNSWKTEKKFEVTQYTCVACFRIHTGHEYEENRKWHNLRVVMVWEGREGLYSREVGCSRNDQYA